MIRRLGITGLVVIDEAEIEPSPGLTAITGETGAGKTVIAQALSLLVGGQADAKAVRPDARHALVEATIGLPDGFWDGLDDDDPAAAAADLVDDPAEVVVAVRVPAEGRARALIDGQTSTRAAAAAIAGRGIRFSSQHEGRRLVGGATQLAILDAFAGTDAQDRAVRLGVLRRDLRRITQRLEDARARRAAAERERAALEDLVAAVDAAALDPGEERSLVVERDRLRYADRLVSAAATAADAIAPEADDAGALERTGLAIRELEAVAQLDPALGGAAAELRGVEAGLQDVASTLRAYLTDLDADPARLDHIEERLGVYDRLSRRYGPGTEGVLARAEQARASLADLDADDADAALAREAEETRQRARAVAAELAERRADAAPRLERAVMDQLADLAMGAADVRVELLADDDDPPTQRATMWLRANPGLPEAPLADAASGGELSRVLLALHGVAAQAEPEATWIFDEVDAGVGGVTGTAVAEKLRALAAERQVIVITHLPQVAAVADRHYRLVKGVDRAGRATTSIEAVEGEALVDELCRMLGAGPEDEGARRHAEELLQRRGV